MSKINMDEFEVVTIETPKIAEVVPDPNQLEFEVFEVQDDAESDKVSNIDCEFTINAKVFLDLLNTISLNDEVFDCYISVNKDSISSIYAGRYGVLKGYSKTKDVTVLKEGGFILAPTLSKYKKVLKVLKTKDLSIQVKDKYIVIDSGDSSTKILGKTSSKVDSYHDVSDLKIDIDTLEVDGLQLETLPNVEIEASTLAELSDMGQGLSLDKVIFKLKGSTLNIKLKNSFNNFNKKVKDVANPNAEELMLVIDAALLSIIRKTVSCKTVKIFLHEAQLIIVTDNSDLFMLTTLTV